MFSTEFVASTLDASLFFSFFFGCSFPYLVGM
jgi:hypothetical protein